MPMHLDPGSGIPIYLQLVDGFIERIATGELPAGGEAPSSRSVAAEERVNYHTVNRAFGILEELGFFVRQRGSAWLVAEGSRSRAAGRLLNEDLQRLCRRAYTLGMDRESLVHALKQAFDALSTEERS